MSTTTRRITIAYDSACEHGSRPLVWGAAEGDTPDADEAAIANAAEELQAGGLSSARARRAAESLDLASIDWPAGEALPSDDDAYDRAIAAAQ